MQPEFISFVSVYPKRRQELQDVREPKIEREGLMKKAAIKLVRSSADWRSSLVSG